MTKRGQDKQRAGTNKSNGKGKDKSNGKGKDKSKARASKVGTGIGKGNREEQLIGRGRRYRAPEFEREVLPCGVGAIDEGDLLGPGPVL